MKLLLCKNCGDIFNISLDIKKCTCGETSGKYVDNLNAVYSGEYAVPLGFANASFVAAMYRQPKYPDAVWGEEFKAFFIPANCKTFVKEE